MLGAGALALLAGGCRSGPGAAPADGPAEVRRGERPAETDDAAGPGRGTGSELRERRVGAGDPRPPTRPLDARSVLVDVPAAAAFAAWPPGDVGGGGEDDGEPPALGAGRLNVARTPPPATAAEWTTRWAARDRRGEKLSEHTFRHAPDGGVAMLQTVEHADKVVTSFEPPLVVLPGRLDGGSTLRQTLRMVVRPIGKPETIQSEGAASNELTYVADETVETPAGTFEAARVRSVLKVKLGTANVTATTDAWYAPGVGLVAQRRQERVTVFGVPVREGRTGWVLDRE